MKRVCNLILLLAVLFGCASSSNIDLKNLRDGEHVLFGNIEINFNGKTTKEVPCDIYVNSEFKPLFKVLPDSLNVFKVKDDLVNFVQIACLDRKNPNETAYYFYTFTLPVLKPASASTTLNYYGDIQIKWNTDGVKRKTASSSTTTEIQQHYNKGKFKLIVKDNFKSARKQMLALYGEKADGFEFSNKTLKKKYKKRRKRRRSKRRRYKRRKTKR